MRFSLCAVYVIGSAVYMLANSDEETAACQNTVALRFLALHNQARSEASVQPLTWDNELSARVQHLVNTCTWKRHFSSSRSWMYQGESGENITLEQAMEASVMEKTHVVLGDTTEQCCSNSTMTCCRYDKVVSSQFKSVGCGQSVCNFDNGSLVIPNVYIALCFYSKE